MRYLSLAINLYSLPLFLQGEYLVILSLSASRIKYVINNGFNNLVSLRELHLIHNVNMSMIYNGAFIGLTSLLVLNISNNGKLLELQPECFSGLSLLRRLDASNTAIEVLHVDLFTELEFLEYLDLSHTKLHQVDFASFRKHQILHVHLNNVENLTEINTTVIDNKWENFTMVTRFYPYLLFSES